MTSTFTLQERAKIAARYEVRNFIVLVHRWWGASEAKHETLSPETIRNCPAKFMTTGPVEDKRRSELYKSISREGGKSAGNVYAQPTKINTSSCS